MIQPLPPVIDSLNIHTLTLQYTVVWYSGPDWPAPHSPSWCGLACWLAGWLMYSSDLTWPYLTHLTSSHPLDLAFLVWHHLHYLISRHSYDLASHIWRPHLLDLISPIWSHLTHLSSLDSWEWGKVRFVLENVWWRGVRLHVWRDTGDCGHSSVGGLGGIRGCIPQQHRVIPWDFVVVCIWSAGTQSLAFRRNI